MERTINRIFSMVLAMMALFLAACAYAQEPIDEYTLAQRSMEQPGALYSDIVAGIDRSSVTTDGEATFFTSVMSDGTPVRFEGANIAVTEDGILLFPGSTLISLDAVGKIYLYQAAIADSENAPTCDQWLDIGYGYTFGSTSVDRASDVLAEIRSGYPAIVWTPDTLLPFAYCLPNFVYVRGANGNTQEITLTSLTIGYDPNEKVTDVAEILEALPPYFFEPSGETDAILVDDASYSEEAPVYASATIDAYALANAAMAQPGALYSDIIAGIDRSSVTTDGDATFFTSIMSDGTPVRFEGKHIVITEDGILMNPAGTVTSLDAVGKIYVYQDARVEASASVGDQWLDIGYGYTFSAEKTSVERADDVYSFATSGFSIAALNESLRNSVAPYAPNFIFFQSPSYNVESFTLTSLFIGYTPDEKVTALTDVALNPSFYGYYMEGEPYNASKERKADSSTGEYDFYLMLTQDALAQSGAIDNPYRLHFLPRRFYEVGDLRDAQGNVVSKETARVQAGYTLDVTIGDHTFPVELPIAQRYEGAQTLKQARPYSTQSALGEQHALVIPVVWADQTELVSEELYALYQKALGRLIDERGNPLGDFSSAEDEAFSLSAYFDIASYGQLTLSSFMTDWFYTDKTFAADYEYRFPEIDFADEVLQWVKATYPDTDWSSFDRDGDGYVDAIVLLSVGLSQEEGYMPSSFGGAVHSTGSNYSILAGTQDDPQANCFLTVNLAFLKDGKNQTLIHEFSHNFGLNDYYDGTGYGINAVGEYDMQGSSVGDWNAYSKLAVGWMQPQVIAGLESGESLEMSIGSSALVGDVILLPAAGDDYTGPFGEYVMIDLLSSDGVNVYDASDYGLADTVGVRISHVNATLRSESEYGEIIGMELYHNNAVEGGFGLYNIEVIQSGGENTFTDLDKLFPTLRASDLFYAGDTFTAQDYSQFFYDGLMDSGLPLGYTVRILDIATDAQGNPQATLRITAD